MSITEEINQFIEENTDPAFGTWQSYIRTRDALNIALARMNAAKVRITQLEAELETAQRTIEAQAAELNNYHRLQADIDMGVITLEMPRETEP